LGNNLLAAVGEFDVTVGDVQRSKFLFVFRQTKAINAVAALGERKIIISRAGLHVHVWDLLSEMAPQRISLMHNVMFYRTAKSLLVATTQTFCCGTLT